MTLKDTQWLARPNIETYDNKYRVSAMCDAPKEEVGGEHYKRMKIDVFEFAEANGLTFMEATVCKYVARHRFKNGKEDLLKAMHTISRMIEFYYPEEEV